MFTTILTTPASTLIVALHSDVIGWRTVHASRSPRSSFFSGFLTFVGIRDGVG